MQLSGRCVSVCINYRGIIKSEFGIGVANGSDFVGHHRHLLNLPWEDDWRTP